MKRILSIVAIGLVVLGGTTVAAIAAGGNSELDRAVSAARHATAQYQDVNVALAAGYVPVGECVEAPGLGGMGFHYLNPAYASDGGITAGKPELLLYAPAAHGNLRLVAVEYFRADADQDVATDDDRPTFYGVPFDGPMLGHEPGMPIHYDLHAWVWQSNPAGTFAQFNPRVHC